MGKIIGNSGKSFGRPAFLRDGTADIEADEGVAVMDSLGPVKFRRCIIPGLAGEELQAVAAIVVDAQLGQDINVHIGCMEMDTVQAGVAVHQGTHQEVAHADELFGMDDRRQERRPFIRMQIDEDVVVMLM